MKPTASSIINIYLLFSLISFLSILILVCLIGFRVGFKRLTKVKPSYNTTASIVQLLVLVFCPLAHILPMFICLYSMYNLRFLDDLIEDIIFED